MRIAIGEIAARAAHVGVEDRVASEDITTDHVPAMVRGMIG